MTKKLPVLSVAFSAFVQFAVSIKKSCSWVHLLASSFNYITQVLCAPSKLAKGFDIQYYCQ